LKKRIIPAAALLAGLLILWRACESPPADGAPPPASPTANGGAATAPPPALGDADDSPRWSGPPVWLHGWDYLADYTRSNGTPAFACQLSEPQEAMPTIAWEEGVGSMQILVAGTRIYGWPREGSEGMVHFKGYAPARFSWTAGEADTPGTCAPDPIPLRPPETTGVLRVSATRALLDALPEGPPPQIGLHARGCGIFSETSVSPEALRAGEAEVFLELPESPCVFHLEATSECVFAPPEPFARATASVVPVPGDEVRVAVALEPVNEEAQLERVLESALIFMRPGEEAGTVEIPPVSDQGVRRSGTLDGEALEAALIDAGLPGDVEVTIADEGVSVAIPSQAITRRFAFEEEETLDGWPRRLLNAALVLRFSRCP